MFIGNPSQLLPIVPPMNVAKIPLHDISVQDGQDFGNLADVLPIVYEELRRLARAKIAGEAPGNTLQTTALVHEAFVKIANYHGGLWRSERDFVAAAAQAMRQILVDRARAKHAARRGGGAAARRGHPAAPPCRGAARGRACGAKVRRAGARRGGGRAHPRPG